MSDSRLPAALGALPSAILRGCFPAERVPRLSALLGPVLSPISLMGESIDDVEAPAWPAFDALGSTQSSYSEPDCA
eukprot:4288311-Pleurochrysis_carterae.AAC.1